MKHVASTLTRNEFGTALVLDLDKPHNLTILFENGDNGLKFVGMYLPHQIYLEKLDPNKKYVILPASSEHYIAVSERVMELAADVQSLPREKK